MELEQPPKEGSGHFSAVCFALSVKEFQKLQVVDRDLLSLSPCCSPEGGRAVALNNTLAFMDPYQMFQKLGSLAHTCSLARSLALSLLLRVRSLSPHCVLA